MRVVCFWKFNGTLANADDSGRMTGKPEIEALARLAESDSIGWFTHQRMCGQVSPSHIRRLDSHQ